MKPTIDYITELLADMKRERDHCVQMSETSGVGAREYFLGRADSYTFTMMRLETIEISEQYIQEARVSA